jgi:hypothetical protein
MPEICRLWVDPPGEAGRAIDILKKTMGVHASPNADRGIININCSDMDDAIDILKAEGIESRPFKTGRKI